MKKNLKREDYKQISKEDMIENLSEMEKKVTLNQGTEPAFRNEFYDNQEEGIYVDLYTGEPLFTTKEQYDAGCGWPSFTKPVNRHVISEKLDRSHGMARTEVRSGESDVHLGHVFTDGPTEEGGLRYCINSAALRFIPKKDLQETGYGEYLDLFNEKED